MFWPDEAATAQLLTDLATALAARDWDVHVIAAGEGAAEFSGVTIHRTGAESAGRLARYGKFILGARRQLASLVRPGDVVVVKTDPPLLAVAVTALAKSRGARVVQWIQDIYPEIVPAHTGAALKLPLAPLRAWRNRAWRASAACVAVSADMRATVLAQGVAEADAFALPNWAPQELDQPASSADIAAVRAEWNVADKFLVAYSGNLGRVHEFQTILAAAALLRAEAGIRFAFVGGGPRANEVRLAARDLSNVMFLPAQPRARLAASLAAADAHFVTLRPGFEQLVAPSKLAGVLAASRPALFVGPPACALASLLSNERCGATFAPGDAARLAAAITAWRNDRAQHAALCNAARHAYESHFRFARLTGDWDALLRRVAPSSL